MTVLTHPAVANRRSQVRSLRGVRRTRAGEDAATGGRAVAGRGGEAMLDEVIVDAWEGLAAARAVACPVCGGAMAPAVPGAEGRAPQGACSDCGAELS